MRSRADLAASDRRKSACNKDDSTYVEGITVVTMCQSPSEKEDALQHPRRRKPQTYPLPDRLARWNVPPDIDMWLASLKT